MCMQIKCHGFWLKSLLRWIILLKCSRLVESLSVRVNACIHHRCGGFANYLVCGWLVRFFTFSLPKHRVICSRVSSGSSSFVDFVLLYVDVEQVGCHLDGGVAVEKSAINMVDLEIFDFSWWELCFF